MTRREHTLLTSLLVIAVNAGILGLANFTFFNPMKNLNKQIAAAESQSAQTRGEIQAEKAYVAAVEKLSPRLAQWKKLSLPEMDEPKKPNPAWDDKAREEAKKTHINWVRNEYYKILADLVTKAQFAKSYTLRPIESVNPFAGLSTAVKTKPVYQLFTYELQGEAPLQGIVDFLKDLYGTSLLHQVRQFSVASMRTSNLLEVRMTIEVLLVNGAEHREARKEMEKRPGEGDSRPENGNGVKEKGILPVFKKGEKKPVFLARPEENYQQIVSKNPFTPPVARGGSRVEGDPSTERLEDVIPFVRLELIADSVYYNGWVASFRNQGNKDDSALLIDRPLAKVSPFQQEKKEALRLRKTPPREPTTRWLVKDRNHATLMELTVVRIDPLRVIFQADGELYKVEIGTTLDKGLTQKLDKSEIIALKLGGTRDDTLKKVTLTKIEIHYLNQQKKDDFRIEGHFLNPEYKDEKMILATDTLPEEFDVPQSWVIKDRLGVEIFKFKVVKVEKDRIIFTAEKKYYSIKAGGNLLDAMAKPLTEAEAKTLNLPAL